MGSLTNWRVSLAVVALALSACLGPRPTTPDGSGGNNAAIGGATGGTTVGAMAGAGGAAGTGGGAAGSGGGAPTCTTTQHLCGSTCVANTSVDQCGTACLKCTAPAGGTAACAGDSCTFDCGTLKKCAAAMLCVPAGGCCNNTDCPPGDGGQNSTCDTGNHTCSYACAPPAHACTVGSTTTCIAAGACCTSADCAGGSCQRCDSTHNCVPALSQDDPTGRCAGTCDAAGACRAKVGQTCASAAGGCVSGTMCVDAYCCDLACSGPCQACDVSGSLGKCTGVASGVPHGARTCGTSCNGSSFVGPASCNAGACGTSPAPQICGGGLTCGTNVCKTVCASNADCQSGYFCEAGDCHLGAVRISSGFTFTCVLLSDSTVRCWGGNTAGALGDPAHANGSSAPVVVGGASTPLTSVASVAAGYGHACAVKTDGSLWCWGSDIDGELGSMVGTTVGGIAATATPTRVTGFPVGSSVMAVSCGYFHTCALLSDGSVWCWGLNNSGQLGSASTMMSGSDAVSYVPLKVGGLPAGRATAITAGFNETCAIMSDGSAWCWGNNFPPVGSLGNGSTVEMSLTPVRVSGLAASGGMASVGGSGFVCSTCSLGVCCWGRDDVGQLGNNASATSSSTPVTAIGLSGAIGVTAGGFHACAWFVDGTASCWGENTDGELGNPIATPINHGANVGSLVPVAVQRPSGISFSAIAASTYFTCGLATNGSAWCWGLAGPELGNPSSANTNVPVQVIGW